MAWDSSRQYWHLDHPVTSAFTRKVPVNGFVSRHGFLPLIRRQTVTKGYKAAEGGGRAISLKTRLLYRASHRDAAVFGYVGHLLQKEVEQRYSELGLAEMVVGYRTPGVKNHLIVSDAVKFAKAKSPVAMMTFDIVAFFDNLNHAILKDRLCKLLETAALPPDLFAAFRAVTRFRFVEETDLDKRIRGSDGSLPLGLKVQDLKNAGVILGQNPTPGRGVPQGLPISQVLSNIYMLQFDVACRSSIGSRGGFYRRYGDDILVICDPGDASNLESEVLRQLAEHHLTVNPTKKAARLFDWSSPSGDKPLDYLGFSLDEKGTLIRNATVARNWAKMKRARRTTMKVGHVAKGAGKSNKVYTKRFHRRFVSTQSANFISYARMAAASFDDKRIIRQIRRLRRHGERYLAGLN